MPLAAPVPSASAAGLGGSLAHRHRSPCGRGKPHRWKASVVSFCPASAGCACSFLHALWLQGAVGSRLSPNKTYKPYSPRSWRTKWDMTPLSMWQRGTEPLLLASLPCLMDIVKNPQKQLRSPQDFLQESPELLFIQITQHQSWLESC